MLDFEAAYLNDVYFEPSDHLAVYSSENIIWNLPVFIRRSANTEADGSGEFFVLLDGQYHEAQSLSGFTRFELQPKVRPRPKPTPLPIFPREHREPKAEKQNVFERLAAKQREWEAKKGIPR